MKVKLRLWFVKIAISISPFLTLSWLGQMVWHRLVRIELPNWSDCSQFESWLTQYYWLSAALMSFQIGRYVQSVQLIEISSVSLVYTMINEFHRHLWMKLTTCCKVSFFFIEWTIEKKAKVSHVKYLIKMFLFLIFCKSFKY